MATNIITCTCKHEAQDKFYGQGKRLHNSCKINDKMGWRCTVCEDEKLAKQQ